MRTRGLIVTLVLARLGAPLWSEAQPPPKVPQVGFPSFASSGPDARSEAFRQGLRDHGYAEGQNIAVEYRWAGGKPERLPGLVAELVGMKPDVIVKASTLAAQAVKKATATIPIVISGVADPIRTGLVASLARPGANVTGTTFLSPELAGKRLELLKEVVPGVNRVAVLDIAPTPASSLVLQETEAAARTVGAQLHVFEVRGPEELESAFSAIAKGRSGGLIVLPHPLMVNHRRRVADLATKHRLPTVFEQREHVEAGGLMADGPRLADTFRRAAYFVDRILKGAKPGDLPVEQPTKFERVINLRTAEALGLTIPQSVLMRADQVIQ